MKQQKKIINVFAKDDQISEETSVLLRHKLAKAGFEIPQQFDPEADLIICIGGDGSLLHNLHQYNFPDIPFVGINTGHLGFFQDVSPDQLDEFIFNYKHGKFSLQEYKTLNAEIRSEDGTVSHHTALNEVVIRGDISRIIHLDITIGDQYVERCSGDGVLVATPAGSTAYNYSLGGAIVDPQLTLMQITPIAPMNTTAYRSFTSSVLVPPNLVLHIHPEVTTNHGIQIATDGVYFPYLGIDEIIIKFSEQGVKLLRFENYDFWSKVKSKLL